MTGVDLVEADLRRSPPPGLFDLVLCRNLAFTYFVEELQRETLDKIASVMRSKGVLVVGSHESLPRGCRGFSRSRSPATCCFERA